jgi:ParB-like chromosome segregation protein Spo0J
MAANDVEAPKVELLNPDSLIPYTNNAKSHPDAQIKKIASSIKNYGWDQPIVVDGDNEIIKGHGRLQAAELLELQAVPVIKRTDLTDAQAKAARIADNKTSESLWNDDMLATELEMLEHEDTVDLDTLGFDEGEIDELLTPEELDVPPEFDEVDNTEIETENTCPDCGYEW